MFLLPNISSLCVYIYIYLLRGELQSSEEYTQIHYTTNALSLGVINDFLKSPTPTNSLAKPRIHHSGKKNEFAHAPWVCIDFIKLDQTLHDNRDLLTRNSIPCLCCRQEGVCNEVIS